MSNLCRAACVILVVLIWQDLVWSQPTIEMLEFIKKEKTTDQEDEAFVDAVTKWAEKDLTAAQRWAYDLKGDTTKSQNAYSFATMGVMDAVAKRGLRASFDWLRNLNTSEERIDAIIAFQNIFKETPSIEIAEVGRSLDSDSKEQLSLAMGFVAMPPKEVPGLVKYALTLNEEKYKEEIIRACIYAINSKDPEEALRIWETLPNDENKDQIFGQTFSRAIQNKPPVEALEWLKMQTFEGTFKKIAYDIIIQKWLDSEPDEAGNYVFTQQGSKLQQLDIIKYTDSLSKKWPEKVFSWLQRIPNKSERKIYLDEYAKKLRKENPKLFKKIQEETRDPEILNALNQALWSGAIENGPQQLCLYYMGLSDGAKEDRKTEFLISCLRWHDAEPLEFMRWARSLRKDEFSTIILFLHATSRKFDQEETRSYVADEMALGPKRDSAIEAIARKKARDDPKGAAIWAQQLPMDNARVEAIDAITSIWSLKNPSEACDWIVYVCNTLPDNSIGLWFPFLALSKENTLLALQKAMKLKNSSSRSNTISIIGARLAEEDPSQLQLQIKRTQDLQDRGLLLYSLILSSLKTPGSCRKVADWLLQIEAWPFENKENSSFALLLSLWGKNDRKSCLEWVRNAPTQNTQQAALKGVVIANLMAGDDPFYSGRFQGLQQGKVRSINERYQKNISGDLNQTLTKGMLKEAQKKTNPWISRLTDSDIRGDRAIIIWKSLLLALCIFGLLQTWKFLRSGQIPLPLRFTLCFVQLIYYCSLIISIKHITENHNILTKTTVLELASTCLVMLLMTCYFLLFVNQIAAGSRVLLIFCALYTFHSGVGIANAILHKGDLAKSIGVMLFGLLPLLGALPKSCRDYRAKARSSRKAIPKYLLISEVIPLVVCVYFIGGVIMRNIQVNPKYALQIALVFFLVSAIYVGPFVWAFSWGDKMALRIYQLVLLVIVMFCVLWAVSSFKSGDLLAHFVPFVISLGACLITLILTFHSSVNKWTKDMRHVSCG